MHIERIIRHHCCIAWLAWLLFALTSSFARAQSPAPLPEALPNLELMTNGHVAAIAWQPDGGVVLGGEFTHVNGTPRNNIARLRPDGTLDPVWNPSANGRIHALAVAVSGEVYVAGRFDSIGDRSRNNLAKLAGSGTGEADAAWNPSPNDDVLSLAVAANGAVYAGGMFSSIGGEQRDHIAKLSGSGAGTADPIWNPSASSTVRALAMDSSGAVYAGGGFHSIGNAIRRGLAKLSSSGTGAVDATWDPSANGDVYALAVDASGAVYAGGGFTSIGGAQRNYIAKLSGSGVGSVDDVWDASSNSSVYALAVDASGAVYAGGGFTSIGGAPRNYIAKLPGGGAGTADFAWDPSSDGDVYALAVGASGTVYAGGYFRHIGDQFRSSFVSLNDVGNANVLSANVLFPGRAVYALVRQPDGGLIVGGYFSGVNTANGFMERNNILRLKADHTLDTDWAPQIDGSVYALELDAGNSGILVGGEFIRVNGASHRNLIKLSVSGGVESLWRPSPNGPVHALAIDDDGALYVGGDFTSIADTPRERIAKLSSGGAATIDLEWNPWGANRAVYALALDGGRVYVGGDFTSIAGVGKVRIALLSGDAGVVYPWTAWSTQGVNGVVRALAVDAVGNLYVGGRFTSISTNIGDFERSSLAKLSSIGQVDTEWNPSVNAIAYVNALLIDPVGSAGLVYVGGSFISIDGALRYGIARLSSAGEGAVDPDWSPRVHGSVYVLESNENIYSIYAGGWFTAIGNQSRVGLARLRTFADVIFASGFE